MAEIGKVKACALNIHQGIFEDAPCVHMDDGIPCELCNLYVPVNRKIKETKTMDKTITSQEEYITELEIRLREARSECDMLEKQNNKLIRNFKKFLLAELEDTPAENFKKFIIQMFKEATLFNATVENVKDSQ